MRSLLAVLLVTVPVALACAGGGSAGGPGPEAGQDVVNLAFSNWKIEWVGGDVKNEFDFLNDGTFVDPSHPKNKNTYRVDGHAIHMEYNDGFVVYDGEIIDGMTMGGTYKTKKGKEGPWRGRKLILD